MKESYNNSDLWVMLEIVKTCNFNCPYCFYNSYKERIKSWIKKRLLKKQGLFQADIYKIADNIKKLNKKCIIRFIGGEPFLFPKFIKLCQLLAKDNYIDILTNLGHKKVYEFADKISPRKVKSIQITVHISELERYGLVEDFITKVKYLKKKGFTIKVYYVMYPPFFRRFNKDYIMFKSHGITITPKAFRGMHHSKKYPQAYSRTQKDIMMKLTDKGNKQLLKSADYNFKGRKCLAGKSLIIIKSDGKVYRCYGDNKCMGNLMEGNVHLYETAEICISNHCTCPYHGFRYVVD